MKTLRLIGMGLFAILMFVNFAACSSNNDDEPSGNGGDNTTNEKKLVEVIEEEHGSITTMQLTYDKEGQLFSAIGYCNETYTWSDNYIIEEIYDKTFQVSNDLIVNYVDDNDELKYDSSNHIILLDDDTFTWNGDQITKIITGSNIIEYTYTGIKHKGWAPTFGSDSSLWGTFEQEITAALYYAHPELFGLKNCELPSKRKVTYSDSESVYTTIISYTFYDDGYVKTRTEVDSDGHEKHYTYKWE